MGKALGAEIELTNVELKYPGLTPWEIWLSEAQERMVLAVPPAKLPRLQALADLWDVEVSVLGTFTGDGHLRVRYNNMLAADFHALPAQRSPPSADAGSLSGGRRIRRPLIRNYALRITHYGARQ